MTLYELLVKSCHAGLNHQNRDTGAMPAGHNGPYHDPETPVRNTGHWVMLFLKAHEITGESPFLKGGERALNYLFGRDARPVGATFHHRTHPKKDACNGLIGQAWSIETLIFAGEYLDREECLKLAEKVFLLHPFDPERGIWKRVAVDGMHLSEDMTFNHQLWFAAAAAPLAERSQPIAHQLKQFMEKLPDNLRTWNNGLIRHLLPLRGSALDPLREIKRILFQSPADRRAARRKAIGYHLFNLYGFALLHRSFPGHAFWQGELFGSTLEYALSDDFRNALSDNPFAYPYNPPGFEMAMTMEQFQVGSREDRQKWLKEQVRRCFNTKTWRMDRASEDAATQAARLYEAVRLPDMKIFS